MDNGIVCSYCWSTVLDHNSQYRDMIAPLLLQQQHRPSWRKAQVSQLVETMPFPCTAQGERYLLAGLPYTGSGRTVRFCLQVFNAPGRHANLQTQDRMLSRKSFLKVNSLQTAKYRLQLNIFNKVYYNSVHWNDINFSNKGSYCTVDLLLPTLTLIRMVSTQLILKRSFIGLYKARRTWCQNSNDKTDVSSIISR